MQDKALKRRRKTATSEAHSYERSVEEEEVTRVEHTTPRAAAARIKQLETQLEAADDATKKVAAELQTAKNELHAAKTAHNAQLLKMQETISMLKNDKDALKGKVIAMLKDYEGWCDPEDKTALPEGYTLPSVILDGYNTDDIIDADPSKPPSQDEDDDDAMQQ